ncbi:hypothetical protein H6P81_011432 [Aristolochia fimbriata]|uniref:Uncharacterized protein n=1 Tax=Aristolochia fimbriata TaxID=158543 RepID=A0AAV7EV01_ARIFI|nr:hypothetical protein H6P81_011432 [Aristolochia fimbriata]
MQLAADMSLTSASAAAHTLLSNPRSHIVSSLYISRNGLKPLFWNLSIPISRIRLDVLHQGPSRRRLQFLPETRWRSRALDSGAGIDENAKRDDFDRLNLDTVLSVLEFCCIAPSVIFSIGCAMNYAFWGSQKLVQVSLANKVFVWQFVLLAGAVTIASVLRRRQWERIYKDSHKAGPTSFNMIERIEKLEEDLKSSTTIVRVLSRQLEKLGIRFRVTRKALKEPITETAALAQKNSEATRALAIQEDILEKELGEIQKVLLAMQEQQQKQLDLILTLSKSGKFREVRRDSVSENRTTVRKNPIEEKEDARQEREKAEVASQKGFDNDKV